MATKINDGKRVAETAGEFVDLLKLQKFDYETIIRMTARLEDGQKWDVFLQTDWHYVNRMTTLTEVCARMQIDLKFLGDIPASIEEGRNNTDRQFQFGFEREKHAMYDFSEFRSLVNITARAKKYEVARSVFCEEAGQSAGLLAGAKITGVNGKLCIALLKPVNEIQAAQIEDAVRDALSPTKKDGGMNGVHLRSVKVLGQNAPRIEVDYNYPTRIASDKVRGFFESFKAEALLKNIASGMDRAA